MPNWCACNYAIQGDREELEAFVNILNTMENHSNGFGRFWMGNLLYHFGIDVKNTAIHCRGTFSPNANEIACLCGPDIDEEASFSIDEDGILRMSTVSAWDRSSDIEYLLQTKFPSFEFNFQATDEFGNFHHIRDPYGVGGFPVYCLDADGDIFEYDNNEANKFIEKLKEVCPGLDVPDDINEIETDGFCQKFIEWREEDEERDFISFYIAEEV